MIRWWLRWIKPKGSRCDIHKAAEEIAEKERRLAVLKMKREDAERELTAVLEGLLTFQEGTRGDP